LERKITQDKVRRRKDEVAALMAGALKARGLTRSILKGGTNDYPSLKTDGVVDEITE
jgi:hypothetical protein